MDSALALKISLNLLFQLVCVLTLNMKLNWQVTDIPPWAEIPCYSWWSVNKEIENNLRYIYGKKNMGNLEEKTYQN